MSRSQPPDPKRFRGLDAWAQQLYEFMLSQTRVAERNDPQPLLLPHRVTGAMERAPVAGVLLYDPAYRTVVQSIAGEWEPLRSAPRFQFDYIEDAVTDGAALSAGANKLLFNTNSLSAAAWASADTVASEITLVRGTYYFDGFYSLTKTSGGAKTFTTYLAEAADLDTPVGNVHGATMTMPASLPSDFTTLTRYAGFIDVPEGGETYALVCRASDNNVTFGTAHGLTGYDNLYARVAIQLVGLNE